MSIKITTVATITTATKPPITNRVGKEKNAKGDGIVTGGVGVNDGGGKQVQF